MPPPDPLSFGHMHACSDLDVVPTSDSQAVALSAQRTASHRTLVVLAIPAASPFLTAPRQPGHAHAQDILSRDSLLTALCSLALPQLQRRTAAVPPTLHLAPFSCQHDCDRPVGHLAADVHGTSAHRASTCRPTPVGRLDLPTAPGRREHSRDCGYLDC